MQAGFLVSWPHGTRDKAMAVVHPARIVQLELDARCSLCEAPSWDAAAGRLLFVDITGKRIHSFDPVLRTHSEFVEATNPGLLTHPNDDTGRLSSPFVRQARSGTVGCAWRFGAHTANASGIHVQYKSWSGATQRLWIWQRWWGR